MRLCRTLWALLVVGVLSLGAPAPMWADFVEGGDSVDTGSGVDAPVVDDGVVDTIEELEPALEAGGEVALGGSIAYDDRVDIVITKPVTLDLNGFTVTANCNVMNFHMFVVRDGGSLTVKDSGSTGKIHAVNQYAVQLFSNSTFIVDGGAIDSGMGAIDIYTSSENVTLAINGGKINSAGDNVIGVRGNKNVVVNMTGGEITSNGRTGIFVSSYTEDAISFNMTGGKIEHHGGMSGAIQIYSGANVVIDGSAEIVASDGACIQLQAGNRSSSLLVKGGTITADGWNVTGVTVADDASAVIEGGTIISKQGSAISAEENAVVTVSGGKIASESSQEAFELEDNSVVKISGGEVSSKGNKLFDVEAGGAASATVSGGKFSSELDDKYLDESVKAVVRNGNGQVSYYQSVDDAIDAAGSDDSISMVEKDPTATTYKVTLKYTDHSGNVTKTVVLNGAEILLPTLENDGWYHFDGWYTSNGVKATNPYAPGADIELTAKWVYTYVPPVITPPTKNDVEIPVVEGGKIAAKPASAEKGDKVTLTVTPDAGQELRELKATDGAGKAIELTENEDGTFTFTMPDGDVEISAVFGCDGGDLCISHKFPDFDADEWYHDSMDWAIENGYLKGFDDDGTIRPYGKATRAQVVAVLARIAGVDEDKYKSSGFADVSDSDWHARVVAWAAENGIVEGYGDGTYFGPDDPVTREQLAVILMRFAAFQGKDVTGRGDLEFPDAGSANDWALDALSWAVSEGLILGDDTTGELNPIDGSARAELVAILMRYMS